LNVTGALIAISVFLCAVIAALFPDIDLTHFARHGMPCLRLGLICAAGSALLAFGLLRKGYAGSPWQFTLTASCLCGLVGVMVLALHCQRLDAAHILVWHLGTIGTSAAVGAAASYLRSDVVQLPAPSQRR
jgi:hypothetical protein